MTAQDSASIGPGVDAVRLIEVPVNGDDHVIIRAWRHKLLPGTAARGRTVELRLLAARVAHDIAIVDLEVPRSIRGGGTTSINYLSKRMNGLRFSEPLFCRARSAPRIYRSLLVKRGASSR